MVRPIATIADGWAKKDREQTMNALTDADVFRLW
jgi:hypothetical protein